MMIQQNMSREDAMVRKERFCFVIKALQVLWLGCRIEVARKRLVRANAHREFSSETMIEASNRLSSLGNRWMELRKEA